MSLPVAQLDVLHSVTKNDAQLVLYLSLSIYLDPSQHFHLEFGIIWKDIINYHNYLSAVSLFNVISTFVCYLMPKPSL